jgi:ABC-type amino acid transport substrate-binding protein
VTNFPTTSGRRLNLKISSGPGSVSLTLGGSLPSGPVLFQLPSFVDNIASASSGRIDQRTGTVTLSPRTRSVKVQFRVPPSP